MIRLDNVVFGYTEKPVLKGVSFDIEAGGSRIIMGPSGSGKSTILRLILGLDLPWSGNVYIENDSIANMSARKLTEVRKRIGMVFQEGALFDSMTIGENVGYYLFEYSTKAVEEIEADVIRMLEFVDLDPEIIDHLPEELSGGMRRRVSIARALLSTNPQIMLFDEPTTGLDPQSTESVLALITKLQEVKKIAVIIVTHQIADAFKMADKFIVIRDGQVYFDGNMEQLRDCQIKEVTDFLAPFRASMNEVIRRKFV